MRNKLFLGIGSVLLENKSVKQTILKNTFWLGVAGVVEKSASLILLVWAARLLGATEYGKFTFALALVGLFGILFNFGLRPIVTREFAKAREREQEFGAILSLKIMLGVAGVSLLVGSSFLVTGDPAIQKVIWLLAVYALIKSFSGIVFSFFQARERMEYQAAARMLEGIFLLGMGLLAVFLAPSAFFLALSYLGSMLIVFLAAAAFLHFKLRPLSLQWNSAVWKKYLVMSWPLALVAMLSTVYNEIDSVMMGFLGQLTETGWYNAAYKIAYGSIIPIGFISHSFYPALNKTFKDSREKLQRVWNAQMEAMIMLAFPIALGGIVLAPAIINTIYGPAFAASVFVLQLLMVSVCFMFLYDSFRQILMVYNQQKKFFWIALAGAFVNIILNLLLIPLFSLYGAAAATVVTHGFLFSLFLLFAVKYTDMNVFHGQIMTTLLGAALCAVIMYTIISLPFFSGAPLLAIGFLGVASYSVCLVGFKKGVNKLVQFS